MQKPTGRTRGMVHLAFLNRSCRQKETRIWNRGFITQIQWVLLASIIVLLTWGATAHVVPPEGGGTTFGPPSCSNPFGTTAEPVNTGTGNYFFRRTDLVLPGRELPVLFTRTYNSQDAYSGPLGFGWTHTYNILLTEASDGSVAIKQGDGHWEFYSPRVGGYRSDVPCVHNILVKNSNGTFTLTMPDQSRVQFNNNGQLARSIDKNGNTLSFSYGAAGNLRTIIDTVGRNITLLYNAQNRLTQITDPIGRTIQYSYDSMSNLVTQTDPNGRSMKFSYDDAQRVVQIVDQNNNTLVRNAYDEFSRVIAQTNGRGFKTTFAYDVAGPTQTRITDPRGSTTIHNYDPELRLIGVTAEHPSV